MAEEVRASTKRSDMAESLFWYGVVSCRCVLFRENRLITKITIYTIDYTIASRQVSIAILININI